MKQTVFLSAITVALLFGCKGESPVREKTVNGVKMLVCSLDKVKETRTMPLSELVESCELIRFEDIDESISKAWVTTVSEKYIGVRPRLNENFKLFDRSGKYLRDIGSIGQGPGEYKLFLTDEIIDDENELIYMVAIMENGVFVYNTSGRFIKKMEAPHRLNGPKIFLSDGVLSVVHMPFDEKESVALQFDADGNIIRQLKAPKNMIVHNYSDQIFKGNNEERFVFLASSTDTLFQYDVKENRLAPVFVMDPPTEEGKYITTIHQELKHGFLTGVKQKRFVYTDKEAKSASWVRLVNDFYGGFEFPGYLIHFKNGWYTWNVEPTTLIETIEKRLQESDCTEDDRAKLEELLSTIDEDSANLLFLGKLK
jgi:hypothetical protein